MEKCNPEKLCKKHKKYEYIKAPNPWLKDDINESECEW